MYRCYSAKEIKLLAQELLRINNLMPPTNLTELARKLKANIHYKKLPPNCDGWTIALNPNFSPEVEYIILINRNRMPVRQRFTIAHEIGHIVLNHLNIKPAFQKTDKIHYSGLERDADIFASELLMPTDFIIRKIEEGMTDTKSLSNHFNVSKRAIEIKLEEINASRYLDKS